MRTNFYKELQFYAKNLTILIVDDEKDILEPIRDMLDNFFLSCDTATNGVKALELYEKNRYDIVLTDINMPKMDGIELSRKIKAINSKQCILVLSGYIDVFVIDLIDIGINGLILKPYEHDKFLHLLCKNAEDITIKKEFNRLLFKERNKPLKALKSEVPLVSKKLEGETKLHIKKPTNSFSIDSWDAIQSDIKELNFNMAEIIDYIMLNGISNEYKDDLSSIFNSYYSNLLLVDGLEEFASLFEDLSEFFDDLRLEDLEQKKLENFDTYLYIYDDLIEFFEVVFVKKEVEDINYLTDSLRSSIYQMKSSLKEEKIQEEELEFF